MAEGLNVAIPSEPDVAAPPSAVRWRSAGMEIALAVPWVWLGASWVAKRSLGWYPLSSAKDFFILGWIPVLFVGLAIRLFRTIPRRRAAGAVLAGLALGVPLLAARYLPGVKQPVQYPIPGRPWLAVSAAPDGTFDLYLMKGDRQHLVAFGETPWTEISVALSPDRRHIAFAANRYGSYDLFVMDLDANGNTIRIRRLADGPRDHSDMTWSPDGRKIAYIVRGGHPTTIDSTGHPTTIDVIGASGGSPTLLRVNGGNPAWSPDGRWIAYSAPNPTDWADLDIWIMRADGSDPRDVIDATSKDWGPKWSPDGERIGFTGAVERSWDVFVANADGSGARDVTRGSRDSDEAYGWSPDGSKILFLSNRSHTGGTFLYFMDPDGANVRLALRI